MTIAIGIVLLGFLIFVHELGHFIAARACGVSVEAFSLGMGPVLLHKTIAGTDWRLSLLPFGGYCSMKDENVSPDNAPPEDRTSFYGTKAAFRAVIGAAGPLANLLFAVAAYTVVAMTGYSYYSAGTVVSLANEVYPDIHSSAADAGIASGDKILRINGTEVSDFAEIYAQVATRPDETITVDVERGGAQLTFSVRTDRDSSTGEGKIGIVSDQSSLEKREAVRYPFFPAVAQGFRETGNTFFLTIKGIAALFKGADIAKSLSGPARITSMLGETAQAGFSSGFRNGFASILQFMALISISLFMMNLLPIPVLDGFLVLTSVIESVSGARLSLKARNAVQYIGIAVIAGMFLFATAGDISYFLEMIHDN